jgi:hypothetical protein
MLIIFSFKRLSEDAYAVTLSSARISPGTLDGAIPTPIELNREFCDVLVNVPALVAKALALFATLKAAEACACAVAALVVAVLAWLYPEVAWVDAVLALPKAELAYELADAALDIPVLAKVPALVAVELAVLAWP